jgi:hypothetical protein
MVVGFTDDAERYAALVRERCGVAWWVVGIEHSERELRELQDAIGRTELGPSTAGSISSTGSGEGPFNRVPIGTFEPSDDRAYLNNTRCRTQPAVSRVRTSSAVAAVNGDNPARSSARPRISATPSWAGRSTT